MIKIELLKGVGTSCQRRTDQSIPGIQKKIKDAIKNKEGVVFNLNGIKSVTPSFLDQLFGELIKEFGTESILKYCKFEPELFYSFKEQI
ncbi:MAG: hypothetical protein A3F16_08135 [Deltaproteobacteria bacterium RIFCSPHIGHO2_12_FULL_43_9]|nr:MAG: hypothetical protein A3F16_08135 [Deltaproteobacteria bacterium RIFCSPHIGHO2_12_FULL_43_9]